MNVNASSETTCVINNDISLKFANNDRKHDTIFPHIAKKKSRKKETFAPT